MASDDQRLKRLEDEAKRRGKLRQAKSGLLYKSDLTELDRLHLTRAMLPKALKRIRHDLAAWAEIEADLDPENLDLHFGEDAPTPPTMTKDELTQFEADILTARTALDIELGQAKILISGRLYSEPQRMI